MCVHTHIKSKCWIFTNPVIHVCMYIDTRLLCMHVRTHIKMAIACNDIEIWRYFLICPQNRVLPAIISNISVR